MHGQQRSYSTAERVDRAATDGSCRSNGGREVAGWGRHHRLMREVNERICELSELNETELRLLCECGDLACAEALELNEAEYARIREDESQYLVFPGHERPEADHVVERTGRFVVVVNRALEDAQSRDGRDGDG